MSQVRSISILTLAAAATFLLLPARAQIFPSSAPSPSSAPNPATTRPAPFPFGNLPPAQPTQSLPGQTAPPQAFPFGLPAQPAQSAQPTQATTTDSAPRATRARIDYQANLLTITADNSSLTQILGDIAGTTGMKITGGVSDERVYGTYGPDTPQAVLTALLDGTSTNILLVESPQHSVLELILTPRNGGPSPPSISTSRPFSMDNTDQPQPPGGRRPGGFGPGRRFQPDPSAANTAEPTPQQPSQPNNPGDTTQQSPNGVKTPEQIYEQLIRQQQQQQQPPQPAPPQN